jgi:iron(III) transport system ATP-binding protein
MNHMISVSPLRTAAAGISVEAVNLSYGNNQVLKGVNLRVEPGEFFAFLGPSGCGKTTLLRLIAGFNRADTGRVLIGDRDVSNLSPWKRDVGMVFQSYALWPHMTVRRNVAFGLEERKLPRAEIQERVAEALQLVGLSDLAERRPSELSGGQQQRVAVARTIAVRPKVLLLDEPLSNLDAKMRVQVRRELRDLQQRLGITTIFVTHDQEEANTICDRIAVMNDGVVQQVGTPIELYEHPVNLFVANFIGTANILDGQVVGEGSDRRFVIGDIKVRIPPFSTVPPDGKFVFRPQDATLDGGAGIPVPGMIVRREFLGASVRYNVRIGSSEIAVEVPFQAGVSLHEPGSQITVSISPKSILWLASSRPDSEVPIQRG